jgi:hypothetical protein
MPLQLLLLSQWICVDHKEMNRIQSEKEKGFQRLARTQELKYSLLDLLLIELRDEVLARGG